MKDQEADREKQVDERFQAAVTALGDDSEGARIGAAILLQTFLQPGYERFYTQIFELVAAHLRLPRTSLPPEDPTAPLPLTALSQALAVTFMEAFPLARDQDKKKIHTLSAITIILDNAYLWYADLKGAWMAQASLRKTDFMNADLSGAILYEANLNGVYLWETDLSGANLSEANLSGATLYNGVKLSRANLSKANLNRAKLYGVDLRLAYLGEADLREADLSGANLSQQCRKKTAKRSEAYFYRPLPGYSILDISLKLSRFLPKVECADVGQPVSIIGFSAGTRANHTP